MYCYAPVNIWFRLLSDYEGRRFNWSNGYRSPSLDVDMSSQARMLIMMCLRIYKLPWAMLFENFNNVKVISIKAYMYVSSQ